MGTILAMLPSGGPPHGFYKAACREAGRLGHGLLGLYVVDALWFRCSCADWLSTGPSRAEFDAYMRDTLRGEGEVMLAEFKSVAEGIGISFTSRLDEGDPAEVASAAAREVGAEAVFVPAGHAGLDTLLNKPPCRVTVYTPGPL